MSEKGTAQAQPKRLTAALKYGFGVGDFGFVLMSNIETFYFNSFLTGAGFTPAIAAAINSVFSIVDACLSWIYGGILNATKAKKWGRYRSWMILTPWIVPFLFAFQFLRLGSNEILSAVIIVVAAIVSHIVWNIGYVANATLVAVYGKTPEDKATLASSRATWNRIGGLAFSYLGLPFATWLGGIIGEKNQWAAAAFLLGILMVVGYWAHFAMGKGYEDPEPEGTVNNYKKINVQEMFVSLFQNPQLILLLLADLAKWCVNFVTAASAIYYFRDAVGNPGLMAGYLLCTNIAAIIGSYVARYLCQKLSNRTTMIIAEFGMAIALVVAYFAYATYTAVIGCMAVAMFFYGVAFAAAPALYTDTIVYATYKTGKEASGWIMGLQNLPLKIAVFLRGVILNACLVAVGWVSGEVLQGTARQGMMLPLALIPGIFCVVGGILMICFRLTKDRVAQSQKELDARRA